MTAWRAVAVDLGAESGRVVTGELRGDTLTLHETHRFANRPVRVGDREHWNALGLFDQIVTGLGRARQEHGELASVGVDSWGGDFALLDRCGALLGNPHHFRDPRTEGSVEWVTRHLTESALFAHTGRQTTRINTLCQLVALQRATPEVLQVAERLLMMPDLMHYWLSGEAVSERCIASTTQLFDPIAGDWSQPVLEALGLPADLWPPIVPPVSELGALVPAVRDATGLARTRVVAPASHRAASAVAAIPARPGSWAYLSLGTWSLLGIVTARPLLTETARAGGFTNEGGVGGTTRLLKNSTGLWLVQECRRRWARSGEDLDHAALTALAAEQETPNAVIDPDHPSLLSPRDMPQAIATLCQRTREPIPSSHGEFVRVALLSLACKYRHTLEQLEALTGDRIETLHVVGRGAKNAWLCQLTADVCRRAVLAGPVETTALGNLLAQALAAGVVGGWDEARSLVRGSHELVEYLPRDGARWEPTYLRFQDHLTTPHELP